MYGGRRKRRGRMGKLLSTKLRNRVRRGAQRRSAAAALKPFKSEHIR